MTDTRTAPKQVFLAVSERTARLLDSALELAQQTMIVAAWEGDALTALRVEIDAQLAKAPEPLIKDAIPFDDGGSPTVRPKRKAPAKSRGKQIGEAMAKAAKEKLDG